VVGTPRSNTTPSPAQRSDLHGAALDGLAAAVARHPRERAPRRMAWARGREGEAEPFMHDEHAEGQGLCRRVAALHCGAPTGGLLSHDPVAAARRVDGTRDGCLRALRPVCIQRPQRPRPPAPRGAPRAHRRNDNACDRAGSGLGEARAAAARALLLLGQRGSRAAGAAKVASCNSNRGWQRGWCDNALASSWVCACSCACAVGLMSTCKPRGTQTLAGGDGVARDALAGHTAELGWLQLLEHGQWEAAALRVVLARYGR